VVFELSSDGINYSRLGLGVRISGGWQFTSATLPMGGYIRARAQTTGGYFSGSPGLVEAVTKFGLLPDPPIIDSLTRLANGTAQLRFLSATNFGFTVLAATNVGLPASNWTVLGVTTNLGGATYQFIDSTVTNYPRRFYRLRFP
jgi:hypothetical protein